tara:strand:+ start:58 stop:342 length:285 start_codon:yes stop_codon:yes gene_type:complete
MIRLNKKAQGISINVIIIAAIALAVLVILFAIFTGNIGQNTESINECTNKGGLCGTIDSCDSLNTEGGKQYVQFKATTKDCANSQPCCLPVPGT